MGDWFDILDPETRDDLSPAEIPEWTQPMLATLVDEPFSDPAWIFERKLDGERCLAFRDDATLRLRSRNRRDLNEVYPELVDPLLGMEPSEYVVDGEVVAFHGSVTSFQRLQQRIGLTDSDKARESGVVIYYYVFDVLRLDGQDTTGLTQRDRKRLLKQAFEFNDPIRYTSHRNESGEEYYQKACASGWEGVIAKDASATYVHSRSKKWQKFKCVNRQEFVIAGYTDPHGERVGFGAILIGYHDGDALIYAGKVGTGFDDEMLASLGERMSEIERDHPPFDRGDPPPDAHWVEPELVGEVGFTEWTKAGRLRHPRFLGLRTDKAPADVVREVPQ